MKTKTLWALAAFALALLLVGVTTAPRPADGPRLDSDTSAALAAATRSTRLDWNAPDDRMERKDSRCAEEEKKKKKGFWRRLWDRIRGFFGRIGDGLRSVIDWLKQNCKPDPVTGEWVCRRTF